jgi:Retrotransposon gag protein
MTMATQTITQTSTTMAAQPARSIGTTAEECIAANINRALNRNPGGNPGGSPGGDLGGNTPGGGPPEGAPGPQQLVLPAGDIMPMGALPFIFTGNKTQAEVFLAVVQTYLNLNFDVPGFNSPMKKVALTLSLMQGPDVELWVDSIGRMLEQLDPTIVNVPALWDQFLKEFREHFTNTHKADKAQSKLEGLTMRFPEIDQYITKFEDLSNKAGYVLGHKEVTHLFIKGLPQSILPDVVKTPLNVDYTTYKQRAIDATRLLQLLQHILKQQGGSQNQTPMQCPLGPNRGF